LTVPQAHHKNRIRSLFLYIDDGFIAAFHKTIYSRP